MGRKFEYGNRNKEMNLGRAFLGWNGWFGLGLAKFE